MVDILRSVHAEYKLCDKDETNIVCILYSIYIAVPYIRIIVRIFFNMIDS